MPAPEPRYGTPNFEMLATWFGRPPEEDGPFWAINLMKYRAVADYEGAPDVPSRTGREADDEYVPFASLAAIGAMIAFAADVERQAGAEPAWDRIGIVRYPSRVAFLEMQTRDDFKKQHVHKDAGMETTIVMSCLPDAARPPVPTPDATPDAMPDAAMVLRVVRCRDGADLDEVPGAVRLATFGVEGVIVGDGRTFTRVAFDHAPDATVCDALLAADTGAEERFAIAMARPTIDRLEESIRTAPDGVVPS